MSGSIKSRKRIFRVTKVQPWCWPRVPVCVQFVHGGYTSLASEIGTYHVLPLEQLKLRALGKTVAGCQGFIPLLFNLFHAPATDSLLSRFFEKIQNRTTKDDEQSGGRRWFFSRSGDSGAALDDGDEINFYHFFRGLRFQVYRLEFPSCMTGLQFSLVMRMLYKRFRIFLVGLVTIDKRFYMNPVGYEIGAEEGYPLAGVVLAPSLEAVMTVATLKDVPLSEALMRNEERANNKCTRSKDDLIRAAMGVRPGCSDSFPAAIPNRDGGIKRIKIAGSPPDPWIPETTCAVDSITLDKPYSKPLVVCCGWPRDIVALLSAIECNRMSNVCILAPRDAPAYARWNEDLIPFHSSCSWVHGSPLELEDLKNAGVLIASAVIILPDQHGFTSAAQTRQYTRADNQVILVRQQIFALFSRVNETVDHKSEVPLIVTTLQERDDVEYLSSPKDIFLLSALKKIKREGIYGKSVLAHLIRHSSDSHVTGWRTDFNTPKDTAETLAQDATRSPVDFSSYAVQSEYRSGRLYFQEIALSLIGFCLPISRYAIDSTFIEHMIDVSEDVLV